MLEDFLAYRRQRNHTINQSGRNRLFGHTKDNTTLFGLCEDRPAIALDRVHTHCAIIAHTSQHDTQQATAKNCSGTGKEHIDGGQIALVPGRCGNLGKNFSTLRDELKVFPARGNQDLGVMPLADFQSKIASDIAHKV